ncbi:hypothetical protein ACROYT_G014397 [Oculina patagonica]
MRTLPLFKEINEEVVPEIADILAKCFPQYQVAQPKGVAGVITSHAMVDEDTVMSADESYVGRRARGQCGAEKFPSGIALNNSIMDQWSDVRRQEVAVEAAKHGERCINAFFPFADNFLYRDDDSDDNNSIQKAQGNEVTEDAETESLKVDDAEHAAEEVTLLEEVITPEFKDFSGEYSDNENDEEELQPLFTSPSLSAVANNSTIKNSEQDKSSTDNKSRRSVQNLAISQQSRESLLDNRPSSDNSQRKGIQTKMCKNIARIVEETETVYKLDTARQNMKRHPTSTYKNLLAPIQTQNLAHHTSLKKQHKEWEKQYYLQNDCAEASLKDLKTGKEQYSIYKKFLIPHFLFDKVLGFIILANDSVMLPLWWRGAHHEVVPLKKQTDPASDAWTMQRTNTHSLNPLRALGHIRPLPDSATAACSLHLKLLKTFCSKTKPKSQCGIDVTYNCGPFYLTTLTFPHTMFLLCDARDKQPTTSAAKTTGVSKETED